MGGCRYIILSKICTHPSKSLTACVKSGTYTWRLLLQASNCEIMVLRTWVIISLAPWQDVTWAKGLLLIFLHRSISHMKLVGSSSGSDWEQQQLGYKVEGLVKSLSRVNRGQALPVPTLLGTSAQSMVHKGVDEGVWCARTWLASTAFWSTEHLQNELQQRLSQAFTSNIIQVLQKMVKYQTPSPGEKPSQKRWGCSCG